MMYRTELVEGITVENVTEKINAKIEEMEKESYRLVTMSFWGTERAVLVFKKGLKGSLLQGRNYDEFQFYNFIAVYTRKLGFELNDF